MNNFPSPFLLCHVLISDLPVHLALIVHLCAYGERASMGYILPCAGAFALDGSDCGFGRSCFGSSLFP